MHILMDIYPPNCWRMVMKKAGQITNCPDSVKTVQIVLKVIGFADSVETDCPTFITPIFITSPLSEVMIV